jgi:hypothetical protein
MIVSMRYLVVSQGRTMYINHAIISGWFSNTNCLSSGAANILSLIAHCFEISYQMRTKKYLFVHYFPLFFFVIGATDCMNDVDNKRGCIGLSGKVDNGA